MQQKADVPVSKRKRQNITSDVALRYRILTENAPVGIFQTDAHGLTTYVNPKWTEIAGISAEEALGNGWYKVVHPDDYERICKGWEVHAKEGVVTTSDYRFLRPDGTIRWVLGKAVPEKDEQGNLLGYIGTITDITELKHREEEIRTNQERFHTLFRNMLEGVALHELVYDTEGNPVNYRIVDCNPAYERILHLKAEQVCGKLATEAYGTPEPPYFQEYVTVVKEKKGMFFETFFPPLQQYFLISAVPWNAHGFASIFSDITMKKEAEKALVESEERYRSLFENAIEGMFRISPEGRFLDLNPACAHIFGYETPEQMKMEVNNIQAQMLVRTADAEKIYIALTTKGVVKDYTVEVRHRTNKRIWLLLNAKMVMNPDGTVRYYEGSIQDITEKQRVEEQLREAQKMESIGTLAGGIAHDFNNILGIILGYITMMRKDDFPREKMQDYFDIIEKNIDRGATLVRQILTFARKSSVDLQPLNVNETLTELVMMLEQTFPKTISLSLQLEKPLPILAMDHTQFNQIMLNLCVNARDAMNEKGTLTLATKVVSGEELAHRDPLVAHKQFLRISVADTGCGMAEEVKAKIFEPFFTTKEKSKGTGLGLSVVYGVVKAHNGFIEVLSSRGKGTTFHLYFPIPQNEPTDVVSKTEKSSALPRGEEVILLVEDEKEFRIITKQILESAGYRVLTANDGNVALQVLEVNSDRIDLLLTDIGMPHISGTELVREVKRKYPHIKILLTSGFLDQGERSEPFLPKPFTPEQLLRKVRSVLDV